MRAYHVNFEHCGVKWFDRYTKIIVSTCPICGAKCGAVRIEEEYDNG